jgi:hypothetical protein
MGAELNFQFIRAPCNELPLESLVCATKSLGDWSMQQSL